MYTTPSIAHIIIDNLSIGKLKASIEYKSYISNVLVTYKLGTAELHLARHPIGFIKTKDGNFTKYKYTWNMDYYGESDQYKGIISNTLACRYIEVWNKKRRK